MTPGANTRLSPEPSDERCCNCGANLEFTPTHNGPGLQHPVWTCPYCSGRKVRDDIDRYGHSRADAKPLVAPLAALRAEVERDA